MIGRTLSHYRILEKIGAGGMGDVYLAEDNTLDRRVALKVLPPELARDQDRLNRFQREAKAVAALNHPNIVTVYSVEESEGVHFITMEYVEGSTLRALLEGGALPRADAYRYGIRIAEGLVEAHEAGIVHRDLKPDNVMIDKDGRIKILDFGLAKFQVRNESGSEVATLEKGVTTPGAVLGTVGYLSPEQAKGDTADFRSDVFSFGALLYEMLTGNKAFGRRTAAESLAAVLKDDPDLADVPRPFADIIATCLKKSPDERFRATRELVAALDAADASSGAESPEPSIAVLPFANMSADPEQEYFCDGIAEDIINALTRVRNLRVVARTSAFAFKDQNADIREIGEKLNVNHVLEGSVRKAGNRLRITVQLINVDDGYHLWSERFDRELDDIFAIQDEISLAIVEKLEVNLVGGDSEALVKRPTENLELHNLLLLARHHLYRLTEEDGRRSQAYLEQAIELAPTSAPAYADLSMLQHAFSGGGVNMMSSREAVPKIREWAGRALALDPENSVAHQSLALSCIFYERNWSDALMHSQKAVELAPNDGAACRPYAFYLSIAKRFEEAIQEIERGVGLDPISPLNLENAAQHYYHARKYERAREYCERCFAIAPDFSWTHLIAGMLDVQSGDLEAAIVSFKKASETLTANGYLGYALAASGEHDRAREILTDIDRYIEAGTDSKYSAALVHFGLGDVDRCLDRLEEVVDEKPALVVVTAWLHVDPFWDSLRDHPRFETVIERMNFPD